VRQAGEGAVAVDALEDASLKRQQPQTAQSERDIVPFIAYT
jgi:hypothetical protein